MKDSSTGHSDLAASLAKLLALPEAMTQLQARVAALEAELAAPRSPRAPSFVTVDQAAELVGVSPKTIRRRIKEGLLPTTRVGKAQGAIRIDPVHLLPPTEKALTEARQRVLAVK